MQACEDTIPNVAAKIIRTLCQHLCIVRKYSDSQLWNKLQHNRTHHTIASGYHHSGTHGSLGTFHISRSDILRGNGRHGREHSWRDDEYKTDEFLHDTYGCRINESTLVGYNCNGKERYLYESILHGYRHTYLQNIFYHVTVWIQVGTWYVQYSTMAAYRHKGKQHACHLRQGRTKGSPHCAKLEETDEKIVESDVYHTCHSYEIHRTARVAQSTKYRGDDVIGDNEWYAGKTHREIMLHAIDCLCRRVHHAHDPSSQT